MNYDYLYDEKEKALTRYVSYVAKKNRYDFGLVYTQNFEGKSIVMSLQNLKMVLMSYEDISHDIYWASKLGVEEEDVDSIKEFFQAVLYPIDNLRPQY